MSEESNVTTEWEELSADHLVFSHEWERSRMSYHSGSCCGIRVVWGFQCKASATAALEHTVGEVFGHEEDYGDCGLVEVVLIRTQLETFRNGKYEPTWQSNLLKKYGFKLVSVFNNPNSDNDCYVFHLTTEPEAEVVAAWK